MIDQSEHSWDADAKADDQRAFMFNLIEKELNKIAEVSDELFKLIYQAAWNEAIEAAAKQAEFDCVARGAVEMIRELKK